MYNAPIQGNESLMNSDLGKKEKKNVLKPKVNSSSNISTVYLVSKDRTSK